MMEQYEIDAAKKQMEPIREERCVIADLKSENAALRAQVEELEEKLAHASSDLDHAENACGELEAKLEGAEPRAIRAEAELAECEDLLEEVAFALGDECMEARQLVHAARDLRAERDEARGRLTEASPGELLDNTAYAEFHSAVTDKMKRSRDKGRDGWETMPKEALADMLYGHVQKGDPLDIAIIAMMLWHIGCRGNGSIPAQSPRLTGERLEALWRACCRLKARGHNMGVRDMLESFPELAEAHPELVEGA